jgi:hypothetical protein
MAYDFIKDAILKGVELRTDLLKWKMIAVGAIGSVGLGAKDASPNSFWVLILVPLLCVYVDIIYRNSCMRRDALRSFVILNKNLPDYSELSALLLYESDHFKKRVHGRPFEAAALVWSSVLLSVAVAAYPWLASISGSGRIALITAGIIGCVIAIAVQYAYSRRADLVLA